MKKTTPKTKQKKRMADGLLKGMREAVQIQKGEILGRRTIRVLSKPAPKWSKATLKKLRKKYAMSQTEFAALLNVKVATIRSWEQGNRIPDGASSRLLQFCADDIEGIKQKYAA